MADKVKVCNHDLVARLVSTLMYLGKDTTTISLGCTVYGRDARCIFATGPFKRV